MSNAKFEIFWTANAKEDLKEIYISLKIKSQKKRHIKLEMNGLIVQMRWFLQNSFN